MKRAVYIELVGDTYFVAYCDRGPRMRKCAAQFFAQDTTLDRVKDWVKNNHRLELKEKP